MIGRHLQTDYIALNRAACEACGLCVENCKRHVLGIVSIFRLHRHAHVDQAGLCSGCQSCVRVCPNGAIYAITGGKG
jgi:NAD-dependent dihydropyrimidine dehydrogenase PreA subunit